MVIFWTMCLGCVPVLLVFLIPLMEHHSDRSSLGLLRGIPRTQPTTQHRVAQNRLCLLLDLGSSVPLPLYHGIILLHVMGVADQSVQSDVGTFFDMVLLSVLCPSALLARAYPDMGCAGYNRACTDAVPLSVAGMSQSCFSLCATRRTPKAGTN